LCQACQCVSSRREDFFRIGLTVTGYKSLIDSWNGMCLPEVLGDNSYNCRHCKAKRNAQIWTGIVSLPRYLSVDLKRYGFDLDTMRRVKIDTPFALPLRVEVISPSSVREPKSIFHRKDLSDLMSNNALLFACLPAEIKRMVRTDRETERQRESARAREREREWEGEREKERGERKRERDTSYERN
jgi:hypothetical protein